MDEATVKHHAQTHADATVAGDLKTAGSDLTKEAVPAAGEVMKAMPDLKSAAIDGIRSEGDDYVVLIRYSGESTEAVVESRWAEREGRPKIVDLKVL